MRSLFLLSALTILLASCEERREKASSPSTNERDRSANERNDYRSTTGKDYDNTGINVRDREAGAKTPFSESGSEADRTIMQKIRRAIRNDSSLSTNAQNIKIIAIEGVVTLRGPVASSVEKESILKKARETPGVSRVEDQIDVTRQ